MEYKLEDRHLLGLDPNNRTVISKITYRKEDKVYYIDSVWVDPHKRGAGLAAKIVEEMIRIASENEFKIVAICPYAIHYFNKHPEVNYILK